MGPSLEQRERRLARVRAATFIELAIATTALAIAILLPLASVRTFAPNDRGPLELPTYWLGTAGIVIGLAWMLWLGYRGPEDGAKSNWRSH